MSEFIDLLLEAGVNLVVDVRELPLSRKKGFSKTALSASLSANGIEYVHLRAAGNPYRAEKTDIASRLALYSEHLERHPEIPTEIEEAIADYRAALLCFEAKHELCHRSCIVNHLRHTLPSLRVRHL